MEKEAHIREVRRLRDEQSSQYCERQLLHNRYQIVELLGKGGFSEVWHAFDLEALTDVAIKIHQLSSAWSDERKSNYIKHAIRENDIQKVGRKQRHGIVEWNVNSVIRRDVNSMIECE